MSNSLSQKVTFLSLIKFTLPTIIMMVFMSLYTMVDGMFVSRFIGTDALSAVNIIYPVLNIITAIAIMLATGASAIIAKKMGQAKNHEARKNFSFIVLVGIIVGILCIIFGLIFIKPIVTALGASPAIFDFCHDYLFFLILFAPLAILQMLFQFFFVTAGKPALGLITTILGGLANIILDYVFIVPLDMGISGAAIATGIGFAFPALFGLVYFFVNKKGTLYFVKPKCDFKMLLEACGNGSSEMVTNLAMAITTFLFNIVMIKYLGEDGVAAITIVLYAQYFLTAIYLGYSSGVAPVISYNYGNENHQQLKKIFKISILFVSISSIIGYCSAMILAEPIVTIFAKSGTAVFNIAKSGFYLFSFSYIFIGINIFASSLFTALSNGKVSAIISFLRTFLFISTGILLLPIIMGVNGIWLAVPIAEALAFAISIFYMIRLRKLYQYA